MVANATFSFRGYFMPNLQLQAALNRLLRNKTKPCETEFFKPVDPNYLSNRIEELLRNYAFIEKLDRLAINDAAIEMGYPEWHGCRGPDGEYQLILAVNDIFTERAVGSGKSKIAFGALRLDGETGVEDYVNLLVDISGKNLEKRTRKAEKLKGEILLPWELQGTLNRERFKETPGFLLCVLGHKRTYDGKYSQHVFAPRGKTLRNFRAECNPGEFELIAVQLCETLAYLHDEKKIYHEDIKPDNIVIIRKNGIKAYFIDWGLCSCFNDYGIATLGYETPELRVAHDPESRPLIPYWKYRGEYTKALVGVDTLAKYYLNQMLESQKRQLYQRCEDFLHPSFANDVYALGITFWEMTEGRGHIPTMALTTQPWIGMMACFREGRWTAREALEHWRSKLDERAAALASQRILEFRSRGRLPMPAPQAGLRRKGCVIL